MIYREISLDQLQQENARLVAAQQRYRRRVRRIFKLAAPMPMMLVVLLGFALLALACTLRDVTRLSHLHADALEGKAALRQELTKTQAELADATAEAHHRRAQLETVLHMRGRHDAFRHEAFRIVAGRGGDGDEVHTPGPDGDISFTLANGTKMLTLQNDGGFYVRGRRVTTNRGVYEAFLKWLRNAGIYENGSDDADPNGSRIAPATPGGPSAGPLELVPMGTTISFRDYTRTP